MTITDNNYKNVIDNNSCVIKVGVEWCKPCKDVAPIFFKLQTEDLGLVIGVSDAEQNPEFAKLYEVKNYPTILFFKDGQLVDRHLGRLNEEQIRAKIDNFKNNL